MEAKGYNTTSAVLLIVFNRPDQSKQVLNGIRSVRPRKIYVAADAPRTDRAGEVKLCADTLALFDSIDWDCAVSIRVNECNLGSHTHIPSAVDWFFENEVAGIVLEDDCVPSVDFFEYCDTLLEVYKDDPAVMYVNGSNIGYPARIDGASYAFSRYSISWGWASWRRAWVHYDEVRDRVQAITIQSAVHGAIGKRKGFWRVLYWRFNFEYAYKIRNWDYRWQLAMWLNEGLACTPKVNLVKNVGFGIDAMHPHREDDPRGWVPFGKLFKPIVHPAMRGPDEAVDAFLERVFFRISAFSVFKLLVAAKAPWVRNSIRRLRGLAR